MGAGLFVGHVLATPSAGLTTTIYAKSLFDPVKLKGFQLLPNDSDKGKFHHSPKFWSVLIRTHDASTDAYVVDNKIAPGGTTGWHSHPGPSLIFVVVRDDHQLPGQRPDLHRPSLQRRKRLHRSGWKEHPHAPQRRHRSRRRRSPSSSFRPGPTGGSTSRTRVTASPELRTAGGWALAPPSRPLGRAPCPGVRHPGQGDRDDRHDRDYERTGAQEHAGRLGVIGGGFRLVSAPGRGTALEVVLRAWLAIA